MLSCGGGAEAMELLRKLWPSEGISIRRRRRYVAFDDEVDPLATKLSLISSYGV